MNTQVASLKFRQMAGLFLSSLEQKSFNFFFRFLAFRGSHGNIHIVSAKTKELLKTLKMNDECLDLVFSGSELWTTGAGGEVGKYTFL